MRLSAVTFDVYGTLVQFHEAVEAALTRIIHESSADVPMQTMSPATP